MAGGECEAEKAAVIAAQADLDVAEGNLEGADSDFMDKFYECLGILAGGWKCGAEALEDPKEALVCLFEYLNDYPDCEDEINDLRDWVIEGVADLEQAQAAYDAAVEALDKCCDEMFSHS